MVKKNRGQKEDAEDIFQQALLIIILRCDKDTIIFKQRVADDPGAIRMVEEYILNK